MMRTKMRLLERNRLHRRSMNERLAEQEWNVKAQPQIAPRWKPGEQALRLASFVPCDRLLCH